jgi:microcystin-dependent protein
MKPSSIFKLTALVILISFSKATFAQITSTGMAIQGIARDASNIAITNEPIGIKFTIHYTNSSNANVDLSPVTVSITTDAFGVFSYVLDMSAIETSLFYDYQLKLKIEQTSPTTTLISDENLNFVPYAVSASNGVPTGTILPFVGSDAPRGWVKCEGQVLPTSALKLRELLNGSNAPDLRGMFLRGAGSQSFNGQTVGGNTLKSFQGDGLRNHTHDLDITTSTNGLHNHSYTSNAEASTDGDGAVAWNLTDGGEGGRYTYNVDDAGNHTHRVQGTTANNSGGLNNETRPVNYGVTYIIKL